jgi:large subunit ribosomal protein L24
MANLASKLKKGDEVVVITGRDKGKKGKITNVHTKLGRVTVAGINLVKKHISQREAMRLQREPGIEHREMPIAVSNIMLADPKDGSPTRIGYRVDEKGNKVRFAKKSGEVLGASESGKKKAPAKTAKTAKAKK